MCALHAKRPLPAAVLPASTVEEIVAPSGGPLLKKMKMETEENRTRSTKSTDTDSTVSTSLDASSNAEQNKASAPQSCDTTATPNQAEEPLTSATGTNLGGDNGTRFPSHSSNCNSVQNALSQPHCQTQAISSPVIPAITLTSTEGAIPQGRLSSDICKARDRCDTAASVSTLSSNESSAKKEFSSLSSTIKTDVITPIVPHAKNPVISGSSSSQSTAMPRQASSMGQRHISAPPLKSTKMLHLQIKYLLQLEYMHREFKKLERQLLGAKSSSKNMTESAGSKERREKLHSFIVHLEETMNQIKVGCALEDEGKSTLSVAIASSGGEMIAGGSDTSSKPFSAASSVQSATSSSMASKMETVDEEEAKNEFVRSSALTKLTKEKEEEENVQKLEEHILANLLPVKERLTKQLAAQQGAAKNPVGMPTRRGLQPPSAASHGRTMPSNTHGEQGPINPLSTGPIPGPTAHSQFGQPLKGGGSSLTQKLHGQTLGSQQRSYGYGVGTQVGADRLKVQAEVPEPSPTTPRKVVYAGMTPGSRQVRSGVNAASGVHEMVIGSARHKIDNVIGAIPQTALASPPSLSGSIKAPSMNPKPPGPPEAIAHDVAKPIYPGGTQGGGDKSRIVPLSTLSCSAPVVKESDQVQKKRQKVEKRRVDQEKQRQLILQQQLQRQQAATATRRVVKTSPGAIRSISNQRKGPRSVEYICALCNETYKSTCEYNPWWALSLHECGKCGKSQIPRLDISAPANAIEYHPALLAHATPDDSKGADKVVSVSCHSASQGICGQGIRKTGAFTHRTGDKVGFESDSDDSGYDENAPSAVAENEDFGENYSGPKFTEYDASRLLTLMSHASTCPGGHKHQNVSDTCTNVKYMMLHVRDCPGTTPSYDICPYPWCRKTKHLLYHLVSCDSPATCKICSPTEISENLRALKGLNSFRSQKRREFVSAHIASQRAFAKAVKSTDGVLVSDVEKKSVPQNKVSGNDTVNSGSRINRSMKPTHLAKQPSLIESQCVPNKKCLLTVPSPISTVALASNPLAAVQTQPASVKNRPHSTARPSSDPSIKIATATTLSSSVNGTNTLHSTSIYTTQKTFSPPNPLKGFSTDQFATSTSFPILPSHNSVKTDNHTTPLKEHHPVIRSSQVKIKAEGNQ